MSETFPPIFLPIHLPVHPPINEPSRVNSRYEPNDLWENEEQIECITYDRRGSLKTAMLTCRMINFLV